MGVGSGPGSVLTRKAPLMPKCTRITTTSSSSSPPAASPAFSSPAPAAAGCCVGVAAWPAGSAGSAAEALAPSSSCAATGLRFLPPRARGAGVDGAGVGAGGGSNGLVATFVLRLKM